MHPTAEILVTDFLNDSREMQFHTVLLHIKKLLQAPNLDKHQWNKNIIEAITLTYKIMIQTNFVS